MADVLGCCRAGWVSIGFMSKPKIAVIGSKGLPSNVSGLEVYVQSICVELSDEFDITVFSRKRYCTELVKEYKGVKVVHIPSINTKHLDAITYTVFATIVALFGGYDLFWFHALGPAVTMPMVKFCRKRIISTVHGLDWKRAKFGRFASGVLKYGEKCIAKCADEIITLQKYDSDYFKEKWGRNTNLISNGVKDAQFKPAELIKGKYNLDKGEFYLFMSRIVPEKGLHLLIEAYKRIRTDRRLVIAGKGVHTSDYEDEMRVLASDNDRIVFVGSVDGDIKSELYSNAYAYILPSAIEGQSIGLLEAMSYGLPCLVSDIPENLDVIGNDSGIAFRNGDVDSLVEVLEYLESHDKIIVDIGIRSKELVYREYRLDDTIKRTKTVIRKAIAN